MELDANYAYFRAELLDNLHENHAGEYCLMKKLEVIGIFPKHEWGHKCGELLFGKTPFTLHKITKEVIHSRA